MRRELHARAANRRRRSGLSGHRHLLRRLRLRRLGLLLKFPDQACEPRLLLVQLVLLRPARPLERAQLGHLLLGRVEFPWCCEIWLSCPSSIREYRNSAWSALCVLLVTNSTRGSSLACRFHRSTVPTGEAHACVETATVAGDEIQGSLVLVGDG